MTEERVYKGAGGAAGIAHGPALVLQRSHACPEKAPGARPAQEWAAYENARAEALEHVDLLLLESEELAVGDASDAGDSIFESYKAILSDPVLTDLVRSDIFNARTSAGFAVWNALSLIRAILERVKDPHISEKSVDLENVRGLLLEGLGANESEGMAPSLVGAIVVATLVSPQEMLKLVRAKVAAIVCEQGSRNSHVAILARNFNVPAVLGARGALAAAVATPGHEAPLFLVDGAAGVVIACPSPETLRKFEARKAYWKLLGKELHERARLPAQTTDGHRVEILANADSSFESSAIAGSHADGVGLFRMESFFMSRTELPSEDEVSREVAALAGAFPSKKVTVRLLDAGADKQVPALDRRMREKGLVEEVEALKNPMGLRGVRVLLRDQQLLKEQCRAIIRANTHGNVRIMIPFVTGLEEILEVRRVLIEAWNQLAAEAGSGLGDGRGRAGVSSMPELGVMIETPAAVSLADLFATEVAFFSVGTNDLTQYALVVDRTSTEVATLSDSAHPALLRMLAQIVRASQEAGISLSLCGEIASDALYAELLIGLGFRQLSCSPHAIPMVKETVRGVNVAEAVRFVAELMRVRTQVEFRAKLQARFTERFGHMEGQESSSARVEDIKKARA